MESTLSGQTRIRTPDQRLRVFVSSTLAELAPERAAVKQAIERLHFIPVMFELGARPHPPKQLYRAYLDQSHVFLGLYWERYGWVAPGEGVSGLEDEFLLSAKLPRLMYVKEPAPRREERLQEMLGRLSQEGEVSYRRFSAIEELTELVEGDLAVLVTERFETPGAQFQSEPALRPRGAVLPLPPTPTVGRDGDIAALAELLAGGARIVSVTGPGGVGKTRAVVEAARRLARDGKEVVFVPLGAVTDADLVLPAIADALGVAVERSEPVDDAIASRIGDAPSVVVLDNFEQVSGAAGRIAALLERCSRMQFLVTSRHLLHLRGEHEYPLPPLGVPSETRIQTLESVRDSPAVELFVSQAKAARPAFVLTDDNVGAVAELVRRLDGLPLALELVAARVRLLTPAAMLGRLGDRLDFLTGGATDLPARQRTLRATLDWSHGLLDGAESALFARLGVFVGGADLEAVEEICAGSPVDDVLGTLASLLEKSLVVTLDDDAPVPRVGMLQTVQVYAAEKLAERGETTDVRGRHLAWCRRLAESGDAARAEGAAARWPQLDLEAANVRAAIDHGFDIGDYDSLSIVAISLWSWYWLRGRIAEGAAWVEELGRRCPPDASDAIRMRVLLALTASRFTAGAFDQAQQTVGEARRLSREVGDGPAIAAAALLTAVLGPYGELAEDAYGAAVEAEAEYRRNGPVWGLAYALSVRGFLETARGDLAIGRLTQTESIELARAHPHLEYLVAQGLWQLAIIDLAEGDVDAAEERLRESAAHYRRTRDLEGTSYTLEVDALVSAARGRKEAAARRFAAADALRDRLGTSTWPSFRAQRAAIIDGLRADLGDELFERVTREGIEEDPFSLLAI